MSDMTIQQRVREAQRRTERTLKTLDWLLDHNQEDRRVTIGCSDCKESHTIMASTARIAWFPEHKEHRVWMVNPFKERS